MNWRREGFHRGGGRLLLGATTAAAVLLVIFGGGRKEAGAEGAAPLPSFAAAHGRAETATDPARRAVPVPPAAPGARNPVYSPDSSLPEAAPYFADAGPRREAMSPRRSQLLSSNPCDICIEGNVYMQWSGSSGYFTVDKVANHRGSGTSGTLKLAAKLTSSYPVWGNTITSYAFSNDDVLGTLPAGYAYTGINSGTIPFSTTIPTGTYYLLLMASEYSGGVYYYQDYVVFPQTVSCTNGFGCTTNSATPTPTTPPSGGCSANSTTLCLHNNRFRVTADYMDYSSNTGNGNAVSLTSDSGYFWFFSSSNVELVCKMVSFCSGSSGNWAFYGSGLTDVQVTFHVTDTQYGTTRTYTNALGHRFTTIADGPFSCP